MLARDSRAPRARLSPFTALLLFGTAGLLAMALVFSAGRVASSGHSSGSPVQQYSQPGAISDQSSTTDQATPEPTPTPVRHGKHKGQADGQPTPPPPSGGGGNGDGD